MRPSEEVMPDQAGKATLRRGQIRLSCSECRRRKQKCDLKQPCNHCSRRYPAPVCSYRDCVPDKPRRLQPADPRGIAPALPTVVFEGLSLNLDLFRRFYAEEHLEQISSLTINVSKQYEDQFIPFASQSPLLAPIATYTGACLLHRSRQVDQRVLLYTNSLAVQTLSKEVASQASSPSDEVISAVILLVSTDLCHDNTEHIRMHLKGVREMLRLRGGISYLGMNGLLSKVVIIADLIAALTLEMPDLLSADIPADVLGDLAASQPSPLSCNTPLMPQPASFKSFSRSLGLEEVTASILDDINFLLKAVLALPPDPSPLEMGKVRYLSGWVRNRVLSSQPLSDERSSKSSIHEAVKAAAVIYCRAIRSRKPFSEVCAEQDVFELLRHIQRVQLKTWKGILGVLHWALAAVVPATRGIDRSFHSRSMFMIVTLQMAQASWVSTMPVMRRMLDLQAWLAGGQSAEETDSLRL
ncbi:hypothetical protein GQ53DRAFT_850069 [Thozetella sp. PMI_491]|nr:hypothetical protein GQ53DRAFT_850069 [Thozetella sp. PMI_491]